MKLFGVHLLLFYMQVDYIEIKDRNVEKVTRYEKEVELGGITTFANHFKGKVAKIVGTRMIEIMVDDNDNVVHRDDKRDTSWSWKMCYSFIEWKKTLYNL